MASPTFLDEHGRPLDAARLTELAVLGYAHFTAMQVRDGRVRGLDLHLARLRDASQRLFGSAHDDEAVLVALRAALAAAARPADRGDGDAGGAGPAAGDDVSASLTVTAYAPGADYARRDADLPRLAVAVGAPATPPDGPLALALFEHDRPLPEVKLHGEAAKTVALRAAVAAGADDAAFVDRRGELSEATIWNLAFADGGTVVWPRAPRLTGVTMRVVARRLEALGVPQRELAIRPADVGRFTGAVVLNSWSPGVAVARIGDVSLPDPSALVDVLHRAHDAEPAVAP